MTTNIDGIKILQLVFAALKKNFKIVEQPSTLLFNTANYGVPQIRKRLIIIGVRKDLDLRPEEIYESLKITHYDPDMSEEDSRKLKKYVSVADAIGDLPIIHAGQKIKELSYNSKESNDYLSWVRSEGETLVFDHITRTQNEKDTERYSEMAKNHWTFEQLLENRPDLNHEKKRVFNNSYTVQFWEKPARTIIAHLSKDGNQFIHPDYRQGRSLSVREAARLQSFPDDFRFSGSMCQQFKQIGNAVPPLFAQCIARNIKKVINRKK